jgi:hypothetical protein
LFAKRVLKFGTLGFRSTKFGRITSPDPIVSYIAFGMHRQYSIRLERTIYEQIEVVEIGGTPEAAAKSGQHRIRDLIRITYRLDRNAGRSRSSEATKCAKALALAARATISVASKPALTFGSQLTPGMCGFRLSMIRTRVSAKPGSRKSAHAFCNSAAVGRAP